ncbi:MAG TPA: hypothetical protein VEB59_12360 [Gemmatimonadales bacterium]|nr:hypothetical protein [Gemmatimonadales bacterium]
MSESAPAAVPDPPVSPLPPAVAPWDPFQLMDRLDEEALRHELEGIPTTDLVYVVKEGGTEVVGLSKAGVDECCIALVALGQVIREEDLQYEIIGKCEHQEALFKVKAARFAVGAEGQEVRLDQVIGVKRQALYHEAQSLDLDARVPSKKYRGKTYRELLTTDDGRDYLAWMSENFQEAEIRDFVRAILSGEAVSVTRGRQHNAHWYEAGAMKAARNARIRLIPGHVREQVIQQARERGQAMKVEAKRQGFRQATQAQQPTEDQTERLRREESIRRAGADHPQAATERASADPSTTRDQAEPVSRIGPHAPSEKQIAFYQRLAESPVFSEEERRRALEWLASRATRATIKDQIDWLKRQVEIRKSRQAS